MVYSLKPRIKTYRREKVFRYVQAQTHQDLDNKIYQEIWVPLLDQEQFIFGVIDDDLYEE